MIVCFYGNLKKIKSLRYSNFSRHSFTVIKSSLERFESPCPPHFVLRKARLDI